MQVIHNIYHNQLVSKIKIFMFFLDQGPVNQFASIVYILSAIF